MSKAMSYKEIAQTQAQRIQQHSDELVQLAEENAHLKARVAELTKDRDDWEGACRIASENWHSAEQELSEVESDLQSARTAAELAATHREALEQLVRDCVPLLDDSTQFGYDEFNSLCENVVKRAKELLGEVHHA